MNYKAVVCALLLASFLVVTASAVVWADPPNDSEITRPLSQGKDKPVNPGQGGKKKTPTPTATPMPTSTPQYFFYTIGSPESGAHGVSDNRMVVGELAIPNPDSPGSNMFAAFNWTPDGEMRALLPQPTSNQSAIAREVNSMGQMVGTFSTGAGVTEWIYGAYYWDEHGNPVDLGLEGDAWDINDSGALVGNTLVAGERRGFFQSSASGPTVDLGTLPGGTYSAARAINNLGQVAGYGNTATTSGHVFIWTQPEGYRDLGIVGIPTDINDSGQVVGYSGSQAFLWTEGSGMVTLPGLGGNLTSASGINNAGQTIGYSNTPEGVRHAVLWTPQGEIFDLASILAPHGISSSGATDINNLGDVVGYANSAEGPMPGFLLSTSALGIPTPTPVPPTPTAQPAGVPMAIPTPTNH